MAAAPGPAQWSGSPATLFPLSSGPQAGWPTGTPGSHMQTTNCHQMELRTNEAHEEMRLKFSGDQRGLHARIHSLGRSLADYGVPSSEWAPYLQVQMKQTAKGRRWGAEEPGSSGGQWDREALRGRLAQQARVVGSLEQFSGSSGLSCALACQLPLPHASYLRRWIVSQSSEGAPRVG